MSRSLGKRKKSHSANHRHDAPSSSSRLSFAELIDMLEPEGPFPETEASAWKSIIDRNEQLIVFYQVDYVQASPNISKCVRIRRDRSDTNVDKLIPTVFVNQQLQSTYVKDLLGRKHLVSHDDLTSILDQLQTVKGRNSSTVNEGFGSEGDDDGSDDDEDIPTVESSLQLPLVLPTSLARDTSAYLPGLEEEDDTKQELEYRILPPKWEDDGREEVLSETLPVSEDSGSEEYRPPAERARNSSTGLTRKLSAESEATYSSDVQQNNNSSPVSEDSDSEEYRPPSKRARKSPAAGARNFSAESEATYSPDVQQNSNISEALKLLPCSTPGPGKVPLIRPPYVGTQLYVCGLKFPQLVKKKSGDKKKYLRALFKLLTGEHGVDDLVRYREDYIQRNNLKSFGACALLGKDFMATLRCHLQQNGITDMEYVTDLLGSILFEARRKLEGRRSGQKAEQSA